jgi:plastocyanin
MTAWCARAIMAALAATVILLASAPSSLAAVKTYTIRSEPVTLGGFQTKYPTGRVRTPKHSGYIVRMDARLVDRRGHQVPIKRVMLHHVVFISSGYPGGPPKRSSCEGRNGEPFYGTGEEHQQMILPPGYGYRMNRRDRWSQVSMFMSHSQKAQRVYLEYTVKIETKKRLEPVRPLWLRASGCDPSSSYTVPGGGPPGSVDVRSADWKVPINGRIVAAGTHLHGSAKSLELSQPRCANRTLYNTVPLWGKPDDAVYRVRPKLHEPGPIATGYFLSKTGIPIRRGETLRVTGRYDAQLPHPMVMAITHVYVARDDHASRTCDPLPADRHLHWQRTDGRLTVAPQQLPLTGLDANDHFVELQHARGPAVFAGSSATVDLAKNLFTPPNLSIARGGRVTWNFRDRVIHIVLLANGPRAVESPLGRGGTKYSQTFPVPGRYNLFCYLHPLTMHQTVTVRG